MSEHPLTTNTWWSKSVNQNLEHLTAAFFFLFLFFLLSQISTLFVHVNNAQLLTDIKVVFKKY